MTLIKYLLIFILFSSFVSVSAQEVLVLKKIGSMRRSTYKVGDAIAFTFKDDNLKKRLVIRGLREDTIIFNAGAVPVNSIGTIYIKNDFRSWNPGTYINVLAIAGVGYTGLSLANEQRVSKGTLFTSAALVGSAVFLNFLKRKKVKIKNNIRLEVEGI